ncbi:GNAT family N-acetyltransferase [Alicyclobacillus fastidiosus]|uniref:GNAT family N-acetyltransferase n=1 Tax=Alicyclobacillus fastidiosus TaxID=392011 RepID=A0ABY6ZIP7_9BACL|nr:GNAT family N-acetyltransferase [Alicyclobacillus fastidiosus]WAH42367.1 GNAT family N-acetyltransferase [Alicyclobacillus fastidiosus]GMA64177.1 N-acetyltransferase [Alicyclobacillus fastidiosus]
MNITQTTDFELIARLNKPIHELHVSLYPQYFTEYNFEAIRDSFKELVKNDSFIFLLLEDGNDALGYAWVELRNYPQNAFTKARQALFVHQISIVNDQKRRGYGTALMNHIYDIAREQSIETVELDYWANNEVAKNFYKKQGFSGYREFVYKRV